MKRTTLLSLLFVLNSATAEDEQRYSIGDCITPTEMNFSWYGEYAVVQAYSRIEGVTEDRAYVLAFPKSPSTSVIFERAIEESTEKVGIELCESKV